MLEILEIAYSHANVIVTILFGLTITYWFSVILGALDLGFLDFDLDPDFERDVSMDTEFDANAEAEADTGETDVSGAAKLLWFFNIGKVPFMVFFSFWVIPTWFICIICSYYLSINTWIVGLPVLIGVLFLSLFIAKIFTQPLVKVFQNMEKAEVKNEDLIGRYCTAKFRLTDSKSNQMIVQEDGSEYILEGKTMNNKIIERNAQGLIIDYDPKTNTYIVEPIENL